MRTLVVLLVVLVGGCSSILGISDPVAGAGGDDGGVDGRDPNRVLEEITIAPDPLALPLGITKQLQVIGHYSDSSTDDLTSQATFALDSGTAITVSVTGEVKALAQGPATISASVTGFTDTIATAVGPPAADHIVLGLGNIAISQQQRVQVHATIVFSDGTTQDGTNSVLWESDDEGIAKVTAGQIDSQLASGTATITASATGVPPSSLIATVSILRCHPVINEAQSGSSASASDEWAEIYNPCTVAIDVSNFTLNYRASTNTGATDTNLLLQLVGTMAPGELRLYGATSVPEVLDDDWGGGVMQQNNGGLALRDGPSGVGPIVDSLAYGSVSGGHPFIEGTAAPGLLNGTSIQRLPFDGNDTNSGGTNFVSVTQTSPRVLNAP